MMFDQKIDAYLIDSMIKVVEKSAIAVQSEIGKMKSKKLDGIAVQVMRNELNKIDMNSTIVIGEGERDKAPMLHIGEKVGTKQGKTLDIALDPIEGTDIAATGSRGAISVLSYGPENSLLKAPDVYMKKIAVGKNLDDFNLDLLDTVENNITRFAKACECKNADVTVIVLHRTRHDKLIEEILSADAKVKLIGDGDVFAILELCLQTQPYMYMGIGGAPEGVLASAIISSLGGSMQGQLILDEKEKILRAENMNITDVNKVYQHTDMITNDVAFVACGVTDGDILEGVKITTNYIKTNVFICNSDGEKKLINSYHPR